MLLLPLARIGIAAGPVESRVYRSRAFIDQAPTSPFPGWIAESDKEIRVWDLTAEIRYLVLPERPAGADDWDEDQLAALVTRDSMIGTGLAKTPGDIS